MFKPKKPGTVGQQGGQADIAVFQHLERKVFVVELKDGDTFDTKKASGELASMRQFADWLVERTGYESSYFFCSFNQDDKGAIVRGAKGRFGVGQAMTGRELCRILSLDYEAIREQRRRDQPENLRYFLHQLCHIPDVRMILRELVD